MKTDKPVKKLLPKHYLFICISAIIFLLGFLTLIGVLIISCGRSNSTMNPSNSNTYTNSYSNKGLPQTTPTTTITLNRFPTVEAPGQVKKNVDFDVQVSLTEELQTPDVEVTQGNKAGSSNKSVSLTFDDDPNVDSWKIKAVLASAEFDLGDDGTNFREIKISRKGDSTIASFSLHAKEFAEAQKTGKIHITFWHKGDFIARVVKTIRILNSVSATESAPSARGNTQKSETSRSSEISIEQNPNTPDMTVYFIRDKNNPNQALITINSETIQPVTENWQIPADLKPLLIEYYQKFSSRSGRADIAYSGEQAKNTTELMRGFGKKIFEDFAPSSFKNTFWQLADKLGTNFKSIQIYTNDPTIPWELMCPVRPDGSGERSFIGTEFAIGRWHLSDAGKNRDKPSRNFGFTRLTVIAPNYKDNYSLPAQQEEVSSLKSLAQDRYNQVEGKMQNVRNLTANLPDGFIHFAGHGSDKSGGNNLREYSIKLEDGDLDLMTWRGMLKSSGANHPIFFLNACEVGGAQTLGNTVDGWAPAVLESGASGYIGALWLLGDKGASEFSTGFYQTINQQLQQNRQANIAEILKNTRRKFLEKGDPTFLAYIFYGDANMMAFNKP